jgi:hypothetical protein
MLLHVEIQVDICVVVFSWSYQPLMHSVQLLFWVQYMQPGIVQFRVYIGMQLELALI